MFSKLFSATLFAAVALAQISSGVYEITNIGRAVYDYNEPNHPLHVGFVSGPKAEWKVELGEEPGSFTFQNVLYNTNAVASFDEIIASHKEGDSFDVQDAGGGKYIVKDLNQDFVWTYYFISGHGAHVVLRPNEGNATQLWAFNRIKN